MKGHEILARPKPHVQQSLAGKNRAGHRTQTVTCWYGKGEQEQAAEKIPKTPISIASVAA